MGGAKAAMMQNEEYLAMATSYLLEEEYLHECENHGEIFSEGYQLDEDFLARAIAERKLGDDGSIPWAAELEESDFINLLKKSYELNCGDECGYCAKNMAD